MSKINLLVAGLLYCGSLAVVSQPSFAQLNNSGDNRDPFSRASQGDTTGLLSVLHNLQNGSKKSEGEFLSQQRQQLSGSAQDFRAEQLRLLRERQQQKK
jgi:hypothetical protein